MRLIREGLAEGTEYGFLLTHLRQSSDWLHPGMPLGGGQGLAASLHGSPCPWLGSFSLPLQSSPPCPLPPSSLALTSSALGSLTHCFPSSLPSLPPSPGSSASPSPEGALATRVPACSSPWAPAPLCAKEAPLQLSQFPSYREVGYKSLSPRLA